MSQTRPRLMTSLHGLTAQAHYWPRALRIIWTAAPRHTLAWATLLVLQGILPIFTVYLTKLLVDSLVAAKTNGGQWTQVRSALVLLGLVAVVMLLAELLQNVSEWVRVGQSELIRDYISKLAHEQCAAVDFGFYESPDYFDTFEQARSEGSNRPLALLESFGSLFQNGITLVAMAAILVPYSPWIPLVLFVSTIPAFYVVLRFDKKYHRWWQQATSDRRWVQYYDAVLTHCEAAAELRLFGLGEHFQGAFQTLRKSLRTKRLEQIREQIISKLLSSAGALMVFGATMAWIAWRALHGLATLGDLALFYQAFSRGQTLMRSLLGNVGQLITNGLYLGNLFAFLDLKPQIINPSEPKTAPVNLTRGIEYQHVTFNYPGGERPALNDFSLFIPAGKVVAIVGANGAGKSTLIKLLCRFYDPDAGRISLDGIDIRELSLGSLRRMVTVLFQFPMQYHDTAARNITLGDLDAEQSAHTIESASRSAGAHEIIARLPNAYDSLLGKWFVNGAELSGGEWQRIALARAYYRNSQILFLDEPTSFMDSWAEADWFKRFRDLTCNRTGIIITHRFTIAMRADVIHVMHEGQIVESGSHQELLARCGLYAQSWNTQMKAADASALNDSEAIESVFSEDFELA